MTRGKKSKGLLKAYQAYILVPITTLVMFLVATIALVTSYAYTSYMTFIIIFDVLAFLFLTGYIVFYFRLNKRMKNTLFHQLYETTYTNINKLRNNDTNFLSYGDSEIKEIALLEKATNDIKAKLDSA